MTTCCQNCSSSAALGNDIASICTECASVSLAGFSMPLTGLLLGAACGVIGLVAWKTARWSSRRVARLAFG